MNLWDSTDNYYISMTLWDSTDNYYISMTLWDSTDNNYIYNSMIIIIYEILLIIII